MSPTARIVLISQRRDHVDGRDETRDALDVRFATILWDMGLVPVPIASGVPDPAAYVALLAPHAAVLSGGNDIGSAPQRDATERAVLEHAASTGIPVLAICRGMQMVNWYQGGRLGQVANHVAVRHGIEGPLAPGGREVNSYHNIGIRPEDLGRDLEMLATAEDGTVEAFRHRSLPWLGLMWHPEREAVLDPEDLRLIRTHLLGRTADLGNPIPARGESI
jgi:putative glutamine amidotransferase